MSVVSTIRSTPYTAVLIVLRGVGQVMFQGHAGTGLLFLLGIGLASPWTLLGAVLGAILGPLVAHLGSFDRDGIEHGIYGFNPTLVGLATLFFLRPGSPITWVILVVGCVAATILTNLAGRYLKFPVYTAPFVLVTWAILWIARATAGELIEVPPAPAVVEAGGFFQQVLRGEAEVMLGANVATGVLFLVGIGLSNPWHAAIAFLGSLVGTTVAAYHGDSPDSVSIGIYGYNAALAAMALFLARRSLSLPILAGVVATLLTEFFPKWMGVPALTAPFVAASLIVLAVIWAEGRLFAGGATSPPGL